LASEYGRYGYRRITALLQEEGWRVNHKRVERIWHREGLKVPRKQSKRKRLWLFDGSCVRRRPEYRNHVWAYDFVHERTHEGRTLRMLVVVDEYTRECLGIEVARKLNSQDVLRVLAGLFVRHGVPKYIRRRHAFSVHGCCFGLALEAHQMEVTHETQIDLSVDLFVRSWLDSSGSRRGFLDPLRVEHPGSKQRPPRIQDPRF
jgi:hypothetical protein